MENNHPQHPQPNPSEHTSRYRLLQKITTSFTSNLIREYRNTIHASASANPSGCNIPGAILNRPVDFVDVYKQFWSKLCREHQDVYVSMYRKELGLYGEIGELMLMNFLTNFRKCGQFIQLELSKQQEYQTYSPSTNRMSTNKNLQQNNLTICNHCEQILQYRNIQLEKQRLHNKFTDAYNFFTAGYSKFQEDLEDRKEVLSLEQVNSQKQIYSCLNSLKERVNLRIGEMMDLVGEIVKVTDQTQLYHNTTSNSSDNTVPFDTCFTNILELLQIKMSELAKKIKKYKIEHNDKNNKEIQVGENLQEFSKTMEENDRLKISILEYERQVKKLKNIVEGMEERLDRNIREIEKVRLAYREAQQQNSKSMLLLSQEKLAHKQTSKKYQQKVCQTESLYEQVYNLKTQLITAADPIGTRKQLRRQSTKKSEYVKKGLLQQLVGNRQFQSKKVVDKSKGLDEDERIKVFDDKLLGVEKEEGSKDRQDGNQEQEGLENEDKIKDIEISQNQVQNFLKSRTRQRFQKKTIKVIPSQPSLQEPVDLSKNKSNRNSKKSALRQKISIFKHSNGQQNYCLPDGVDDVDDCVDNDVNDFSQYTTTQQNIYQGGKSPNTELEEEVKADDAGEIINKAEGNKRKSRKKFQQSSSTLVTQCQNSQHSHAQTTQSKKHLKQNLNLQNHNALPTIIPKPNRTTSKNRNKYYRLTLPAKKDKSPHNNQPNNTSMEEYSRGSGKQKFDISLQACGDQNEIKKDMNKSNRSQHYNSTRLKSIDMNKNSMTKTMQGKKLEYCRFFDFIKSGQGGETSKFNKTVQPFLVDSNVYSQSLTQRAFQKLSTTILKGNLNPQYSSLQPMQIANLFTVEDVENLYLCVEGAIEHQKKKNGFKDSYVDVLKVYQIQFVTKVLTLIAKLHSSQKGYYEAVRGLLIFPFQSIISQQNYILIQKSAFNEVRLRESLIKILLAHKNCKGDSKLCLHLSRFVARIQNLIPVNKN